ncbi:hypothetical protein BS78_05G003500 [Paspalum vaginatum]|nr:hypothetical protein BS78_05G003500 [Paspalum vaginatum]
MARCGQAARPSAQPLAQCGPRRGLAAQQPCPCRGHEAVEAGASASSVRARTATWNLFMCPDFISDRSAILSCFRAALDDGRRNGYGEAGHGRGKHVRLDVCLYTETWVTDR